MKSRAFGENLRKWRDREGLSLRQAAGRLGVSHAQVLKYERGSEPRAVDAIRIAEVVGIPVESLMQPGGFEDHQA